MYVGRDFDPAQEGESEVFAFDFARDIQTGDTLQSATFTCEVSPLSAASDPGASGRLSGSAVVAGTKAQQRIFNLQRGVLYKIEAAVVTQNGNTHKLWAHCLCEPLP